jgi:hypothetical protein
VCSWAGGGLIFGQRDCGSDLFAEGVVRDADDGGLADGGMLMENFFDVAWIDVVSAADDQVFFWSTM